MKLAFQKAMKNAQNLNHTSSPTEEVTPSFNCNTTIGRIEQMCFDLLQNKDPTEVLKIARMQDSLSGTPSLFDFDQQLTDSSDGEFWDEVDAQQEANLLRYHEFINERKKLFPELYITENTQTKEASNEESSGELNKSESEIKTIQEAKEQLKKASLQIEELYKAKDVEVKEFASSSQTASNIETVSTIQRDSILHQGPCLDHESSLEDLLTSPEAQELSDLIPVLPELSTTDERLEQEFEDSEIQNKIIAARIERIWFILQMSIEDKMTMVLDLIQEANLGDLNETLILWELAAAAVLHREHLLLQLQDLRITIEDNLCSLEVLSFSRELCLGLIFATRHVKSLSEKLTNGIKVAGISYPPNQALTESDTIKFYLWCQHNNKQNTLNNTMY